MYNINSSLNTFITIIFLTMYFLHYLNGTFESSIYGKLTRTKNETKNSISNSINMNSNDTTVTQSDDEVQLHRIEYSKRMQSYMNNTIDPCDDFYEYACGNWPNVIENRFSSHKRSNLKDITYKFNDIIEEFLQLENLNHLYPEYNDEFRLMQIYYRSCSETQLYPITKSVEYLLTLKRIGGFPAIDHNWNSELFDWFNFNMYLSEYGIDNLIREYIMPQYPFDLHLKSPRFGFEMELLPEHLQMDIKPIMFNTKNTAYKLNEYRMRSILQLYDITDNDRINSIIQDIFHFIKLSLLIVKDFEENLPNDMIMNSDTASEVDREFMKRWLSYYRVLWYPSSSHNESAPNPRNFESSMFPEVFLYQRLNRVYREHPEAVANYLSMKFLFHLNAHLTDAKHQRDYCLLMMRQSLPYLIDQLYMKMFFNQSIGQEVEFIIKEVRKSLHDLLIDVDWLDESTRIAALKKEATMTIHIGRYENRTLTNHLIKEMKQLEFIADNYDYNNLLLRKFHTYMKRYNRLHRSEMDNATKPLELLFGMQINSFYYNLDNAIYVMAGALHPPSYHNAWPYALKFGTLGYLIGHELTHGFDGVGANYDGSGTMKFWWSRKSRRIFEERTNCYVDHYQQYRIPTINSTIDGQLTNDENIADGGGLKEALLAYHYLMSTMQDLQDSERMPNLQLSAEQLFFLGFAQLWCSSYDNIHYWEELYSDHTISKYRVLGAVTNLAEFSSAYNCPLGSKMNPTMNKCKLW